MGMPAHETYWTLEMVRALPDDGNRYEVLDGMLLVSPAPSLRHQIAAGLLYEILAKYTRAPAEVLAVARTPFHEPDGLVHVEDFETLQQFFVEQGAVRTPIDISAVVDPSFAEAGRRILAEGTLGR